MALFPRPSGISIIFLCSCEGRDFYWSPISRELVIKFGAIATYTWFRSPDDIRSNDIECATGLGRAKTRARQLGLI